MSETLHRRMTMTISPGKLITSDDTGPAQQHQVRLPSGYELLENVRVAGLHGIVSHPLPGADVIVLFLGGYRSNPVIIAHNDQAHRRRDTQPGECGLADDQGISVMLRRAGLIVDGGGKPVLIRNASKVRIEGDLEVTGEVKALCDSASVTLGSHAHTHAGGTGNSGPPAGGT